ncbi:hypothetical protein AH868_004269 [Salmonella enterica subsp. enterica serovar Minnesota]|nr:hypothetical protein [Salmonella enterica]EBL6422071.1 hypothetical protein [Salmonella enterica subsp. enterica serovar Give]EDP9653364.1 hypothetical protein [Salmonella enterica subsp. enterica serovar Minnesota]EDT6850768.1 hypothetical protein [Salmonella enterica subsp. enterica]EDW2151293.1 hypothetical protein [Salmonella enterica subsp. houtenae]EAO6780704.1 hypothetical protein [Salmonella enterica]
MPERGLAKLREIEGLMLKQKGKRPVALLILFYIVWVISDMSSSTVFQQIYYVLCLISSILALGVFVMCAELNERAAEKQLSNNLKSESSAGEVQKN